MELGQLNSKISDLQGRFRCPEGVPLTMTASGRLEEVDRELEDPTVWENQGPAQALGKERASLESVITLLERIDQSLTEARSSQAWGKRKRIKTLFAIPKTKSLRGERS
ncbi:MAG: hypothetical protein CM1200mP36_02000 [Gammaproteobacteria bacterium]|nr:MAG: hypothetical protein CM1200mP36_02000 [Gammaproteobacteria bacterium]